VRHHFLTPCWTPAWRRTSSAASPANATPNPTSSLSAAKSPPAPSSISPRSPRDTIREIGYVNDDDVFHADKVFVNTIITQQSPDIKQGVDARKAKGKKTSKQGAGDQGLMFGYACNETPELMPAPIMFAHRLGPRTHPHPQDRQGAVAAPDAKSQVSVVYVNDKPVAISNVVISTQHSADVEHCEIEKFCIENIVKKSFTQTVAHEEDRIFSSTRPDASSSAGRRATPV